MLGLRVVCWWVDVSGEIVPCASGTDAGSSATSIQARGIVTSVSRIDTGRYRLDLLVTRSPTCPVLEGKRLRLSWFAQEDRAAAASRLLEVDLSMRLKTPWGARNPGGFNYRLWLLGKGYYATGYVRALNAYTLQPTDRRRNDVPNLGLLRAMALGDRSGVAAHHWALFRATGTVHLMVVSGLHLAVLAGLATWFAWGPHVLAIRQLSAQAARIVVPGLVVVVVLGFAWTTGLQPPVVRASLMLLVYLGCTFRDRDPPRLLVLGVIACFAIAIEPGVIFLQGFWLSYLAVGVLLMVFQSQLVRDSWLAALLKCQLALQLALTPILGGVVGEVPLIAPVANLLAVPIITLLTLPAALLGFALEPMGVVSGALLNIAGFSLQVILTVLARCADIPTGGGGFFALSALFSSVVLGLCVVLSTDPRTKCLAFVCWLAVFCVHPRTYRDGQFSITVLDVGQGSAAIVRTRERTLLVDTGAASASGFNFIDAAVVPSLKGRLQTLDRALISHLDNDHAGGLPWLAGVPTVTPVHGCEHGRRWVWDGVEFTLLRYGEARNPNDGSCTLLIEGQTNANEPRSAYFSGDIGVHAERALLDGLPLRIDLLIVPHHGSRTSSSFALVRRAKGGVAIVSAGKANRYGHPHADVMERYRAVDVQVFTTADSGALVWASESGTICAHRVQLGSMYLPMICERD